jgi:hypothetical protein
MDKGHPSFLRSPGALDKDTGKREEWKRTSTESEERAGREWEEDIHHFCLERISTHFCGTP